MVVMAQVVEWSLQTLGIRGSNPVISKFCLLQTVLKRRKWGEKRPGIAQLKKSEQMIKVQIGCETKNSFGGYVNIYMCSNDVYFQIITPSSTAVKVVSYERKFSLSLKFCCHGIHRTNWTISTVGYRNENLENVKHLETFE